MNTKLHRENTLDIMQDNSILVLHSGIAHHTNEDDYYPFEENSSFFWMTGSERQKQSVVLMKVNGVRTERIFIEETDPFMERWTGKMPTKEEMAELADTSVDNIGYMSELDTYLSRNVDMHNLDVAYFDTYRCEPEDMDDYNVLVAKKFHETYPHIRIASLRPLVGKLRRIKNQDEIDDICKAISITDKALKDMLTKLKPGMKEYQAQAIFEASCRYQGATRFSFGTIAGSGINACSMHYSTNRDEIQDGDLVLFDLGAKYNNYCSDISRTYPVNGKFTERQREVYEIVLEANKAVKAAARPGLTTRDLNEITKEVLGKGLIRLGLIDDISEVGKYYMHGVSHFIGIDCHDIAVEDTVLRPGSVISDEPGLYINEEKIGIRIEDDLMITEDGCICLSEGVMREADEIESFMAAYNEK